MTLLPALLCIAAQSTAFKPYAHSVMLWVPPYGVSEAEAQLNNSGVGKAVTHLALQFWVPTKDGRLALDASSQVNDAAITCLRDWGHANGARVMLTVYNGEHEWDWPLAKAGFADHPGAFADRLVKEMETRGLDGIDIDLEGPGDYETDKPAYLSFIKNLSTQLRPLGKQLTLDSFSYKWNAPNQGWWPDLFPLVDEITTMGYQEIGLGAADWKSYASQITSAGSNASKLQLGVPSSRDTWSGNSSAEQLTWIQKDGRAGIGIWDARLRGSTWRQPDLWQVIDKIRSGPSG